METEIGHILLSQREIHGKSHGGMDEGEAMLGQQL
jgi:hypothetical protein